MINFDAKFGRVNLTKIWGKFIAKYNYYRLSLSSESRWVSVFESTDVFSAQIRKIKLEDEGVQVQLFNQIDSSYNNFGFVKIEVPKEQEELAIKILETFR